MTGESLGDSRPRGRPEPCRNDGEYQQGDQSELAAVQSQHGVRLAQSLLAGERLPSLVAKPGRIGLQPSHERVLRGAMAVELTRSYVIGLGANLGDRLATLKSAVLAIQAEGHLAGISDLYQSAPVGPPQPDFLNAAVLLEAQLEPGQLLARLLEIERSHGRERRERWGPRTLDLDLLFSPGLEVREPNLTVPHPQLPRRAFALAPLVDLLPAACEPASGERYADLLSTLGDQGICRVERNHAWDPRPNQPAAPGRAE